MKPQINRTVPTVDDLAVALTEGKFGDFEVRKQKLGAKYESIQALANLSYGIESRENVVRLLREAVADGIYGQEETLRQRLGDWYDDVVKQ